MNNRFNMNFHMTALSAALTLALASPVFADNQYRSGSSSGMSSSQGSMASEKFGQADLDRDGKLSRNEFQVLQQSLQSQPGAMVSTDVDLRSKHVKDLKGVEVQNQGGTKIGKVKELVASRQDNRLHAVISVGGVLGIGDTELAMPLDQLTWQQDKLIAPTTASKEQLKQQPGYNKTAYLELEGDKIIGELGGMAMQGSQMAKSFDTLDANKDERIDRSEFSAFETSEMPAPASSGTSAPSGSDMREKTY